MKKLVFGFLAALLGFLAIAGGICIGLGMIAYGIWLIVLMVKGTIAVSFWGICKVVLCWFGAGICGWIWGILVGFLAAFCAAMVGQNQQWKSKKRSW